jgi:UPF0148 protein
VRKRANFSAVKSGLERSWQPFCALHKAFQRELQCRTRMPLDDKELEQISKMLERGGKMLANHCAACKSPLFEFQGKTMCPVCEYRKKQDATQAPDSPAEVLTQTAQSPQSAKTRQGVPLHDIIAELMSRLALEMSTETDLARIDAQLECIERGLRIIQLIRGIDFVASDARNE